MQGAERALPAYHRHPVPGGRQGERRHHLLHRQEHQGLEPRLHLRGRGNKSKNILNTVVPRKLNLFENLMQLLFCFWFHDL